MYSLGALSTFTLLHSHHQRPSAELFHLVPVTSTNTHSPFHPAHDNQHSTACLWIWPLSIAHVQQPLYLLFRFSVSQFQLPVVNHSLTLNGNLPETNNSQVLNLSHMMKSRAELLCHWGTNHPFVQYTLAVDAPPPPRISHLAASLVIKSTGTVSRCLCFT